MGYPTKKLGEIAIYINGKAFKPSDWGEKGLPIVRIQNLNGNNQYNYFNGNIEDKYLINDGDILISWSASLDVYIWNGGNAVLNQHIFKVLIDKNIVNKKFFFYLIKNALTEIIHNTHGVGMKHITKGNFEKIKTIFPPLPTQKLIVQKLDSSFEKIDKSIELTKKNLVNIEELNKSVLEEVFRENGDKIKKLKDIVTLIMGQSPKSETYNRNGVGLPFFQGKKEFGEINPIPEVFCSKPIKIAEKGDILISVRAPVGPTNIANEKCCIGRGLGAIRPNSNIIELSYLLSYFKKFESEISSLGKGSTFASITKSDLENLKIPLPPLPKQKEIVSHLDQVFEKNKALKESYERKLKNLEEMKQSLLKEAFEGRLVRD